MHGTRSPIINPLAVYILWFVADFGSSVRVMPLEQRLYLVYVNHRGCRFYVGLEDAGYLFFLFDRVF